MITGKLYEPASMSVAQADNEKEEEDDDEKEVELDEKAKEKQEQRKEKGIDVIYVADIDLIISQFFAMRARPDNEFFQWKLENATFLLNVIDSLAGNHEFVQIRKRKPKYTTLMAVEKLISDARDEQEAQRKEKQKEVDAAKDERDKEARKLVEEYTKKVRELEAAITSGDGDEREIDEKRRQLEAYQALVENQTVIQQRQLQVNTEKQQQELNKEVKRIQREQDKKIQDWQFQVKLSAVLIPPIPLILIGLGVFIWRRFRERECVSAQRMK